ncbi:MAG TPA: hypothetical protein VMF67_09215 [Rhizomicrobium sp.]|nr:hypothetical protein [Rhizomicrobium sp.]
MKPGSVELLERIAETLDQTVLPALADDKWAASAVRSATTLLHHLAKRIELEAPILLADNSDAKNVLAGIVIHFRADMDAEIAGEIDGLIGDAAPIADYDVTALDARNRRYQAAMARLLDRGAVSSDRGSEIRGELRAYFKRRSERERDMYFPSFTGPPF